MCKNVRYIYYCEELFVIKHKSRHSCVSAIFYNLGPAAVTNHCKFDYMYNATVPPVILDGGRDVLLANFHGPRSLKCSSVNGGLAKPAPELSYAVVNREFLCDCRLEMEHASVLRQLSSCSPSSSSKMEVKFVINLAFWQMFKKRSPASASNICRATTRPPRPSSTAECLRLIARLREEQASAASWEPRPPFEAAEMD